MFASLTLLHVLQYDSLYVEKDVHVIKFQKNIDLYSATLWHYANVKSVSRTHLFPPAARRPSQRQRRDLRIPAPLVIHRQKNQEEEEQDVKRYRENIYCRTVY